MTFNDIHQRVAADLSFDAFCVELITWFELLHNSDDSDIPCPWSLTSAEHLFVYDNIGAIA